MDYGIALLKLSLQNHQKKKKNRYTTPVDLNDLAWLGST